MRRRLLAAILALSVLAASGCSSGTSRPALSDAAAHQLQADVLAVTQSAAAHDWTVARANLDKLTKDLAAARSAGTVSPARAASIQAAIAALRSDIAASAQSSAPAKTTPAATSSHPAPPTKRKKKGGGDGGGD